MCDWDEDFGHNELITMSQKIYENREQKKHLELELSEEKLRCKYIPKKKENAIISTIMPFLLLCPAMLLVYKSLSADWMMIGVLMFLLVARLILKEAKTLSWLIFSSNIPFMERIAEKYNFDTYQRLLQNCTQKIASLQKQILQLDTEIDELVQKRKKVLEEQKIIERTLNGDKNVSKFDFSLKEEKDEWADIATLHEYYLKDEEIVKKYLYRLNANLQLLDRKIIEIDEGFEGVKKYIFFTVIVFVLVVLIQSQTSGTLAVVTSIICSIVSLVYVFYLEKKIKEPILMYLIEHDSNLTVDYAFCNNIVPVKRKRADQLEEIEKCNKELQEIRRKMDALEVR